MMKILALLFATGVLVLNDGSTGAVSTAFIIPRTNPVKAGRCGHAQQHQATLPMRKTLVTSPMQMVERSSGDDNISPEEEDVTTKNTVNGLWGAVRAFGVTATLLSTLNVGAATGFSVPDQTAGVQHPMDGTSVLASSSIAVSEAIKTMDMSLPSSYDSIADAKASGTNELAVEITVGGGAPARKKKPAAAKKKKSSSSGGVEGISLPSLGGKVLTAEEKAEIAAEKAAERKAVAEEKAALAEQKASERIANLEAEREAKKAAAKEAAAAAAAKKESKVSEKKLAGAEFVDFGLPTYDAGPSGKKASPYAL